MAKKSSKKSGSTTVSKKTTIHPSRRWVIWVVPIIVVLFLLGMVFSAIPSLKKEPRTGPQFRKEGTLWFIQMPSGKNVAQIDIEIADDDMTRSQGLMWRRTMGENQGMLFIMDKQEAQSFWMRNTYISLDIIFVNAQKEIVKIRTNTKPQSLDQVTSELPALYVIEVNTGFCKKYGIKEGDKIQFENL